MTNALSMIITAVHLAALSQIESGDNDQTIGKNGEVTCYQIKPAIFLLELPKNAPVSITNRQGLDKLVTAIWQVRVNYFIKEHHAKPTPQQLYLLWHRPARVFQPTERERERAERFANLVADLTSKTTHTIK